jgi:hypothetical protein
MRQIDHPPDQVERHHQRDQRLQQQPDAQLAVIVNQAVVDARLRREPPRRDARIPGVGQQPLRRIQQRLLGGGAGRRLRTAGLTATMARSLPVSQVLETTIGVVAVPLTVRG